MERISLPTKIGVIALRVKKIKREAALLETLEGNLEFDFPLNLLPPDIAEGEKLNLKVFNEIAQEESSDAFARKLLEKIINGSSRRGESPP
ncbi:MAG: hypothetical protein WC304_00410 [Candidatus Gracilibacteria bacterium]